MSAQAYELRSGESGLLLSGPDFADGDVLTYNAATGLWSPVSPVAGSGGFRIVPDIAARDALPAKQNGMLVYVDSLQVTYELAADLVTWIFYDASPALASQADWYIDSAGSNNNDGKLGNPLADYSELSRRLCPRGATCYLTNDVNVHTTTLTPFALGELILNVGTNEPVIAGLAFWTIRIFNSVSPSASITLSGVVNPNAPTDVRGELTTLAGTFVNHERIRMTSGTAIGAVAYSTGLHAGAQNTYCSIFSVPTIEAILANNGHGTTPTPVPGDTCVVDTLLVSINRVHITCSTFARVFLQDVLIVGLWVDGASRSPFAGTGGNVFLSGCVQNSLQGAWYCNTGGAFLLSCRLPVGHPAAIIGTGWCLIECVTQDQLALDGQAVFYGLCIDGGALVIGQNNDTHHPGEAQPSKAYVFTSFNTNPTGGAIECENGTGGGNAAILICDDSVMVVTDFNSYLWGASAPFGFGIRGLSNGYVTQGNVSPGVLLAIYKIPSIVNLCFAELEFAYSDNPICLPNSNAGLIAANYILGPGENQTDGGFYLKAQNANIGSTAFVNLINAGLYKISAYVATTTADGAATGTPVLNAIFTDDSGVARTVPVAIGSALAALGGGGGSLTIESNGSVQIHWSVTGVIAPATAKFSVRCRIEYVPFGP